MSAIKDMHRETRLRPKDLARGWSRHAMDGIESESIGFFGPETADAAVGCEAFEGLEPLCEGGAQSFVAVAGVALPTDPGKTTVQLPLC